MYSGLVYPDKWENAIKRGYTMKTLVQVYDPTMPSTPLLDGLEITEGETHHDKTAAVRSTCKLTLTDPEGTLTPEDAYDALAPYGNELRLWRGIDYLDSTYDLVPLGVYSLEEVEITDSRDNFSISLKGMDRVVKIQRGKFTTEYVVSSGQNYVTEIEKVLRYALPTIEFWSGNSATSELTPRLVFAEGGDPHKAASDMCDAIGFQMPFFDGNGYCRLVAETDPSVQPISWEYAEDENSIYLSGNRRITREGVYNHFIVTGESTENATPVRAEASDENESSPTYHHGKFGHVHHFFSSQFITTTAQAQAAANRRLWNMKGRQEDLHFNQIVNPAHEVGDVIMLTRDRLKLDGVRYIIDKLSIPMIYMRGMDVQTRRVT